VAAGASLFLHHYLTSCMTNQSEAVTQVSTPPPLTPWTGPCCSWVFSCSVSGWECTTIARYKPIQQQTTLATPSALQLLLPARMHGHWLCWAGAEAPHPPSWPLAVLGNR
jgi:hypothetical protein